MTLFNNDAFGSGKGAPPPTDQLAPDELERLERVLIDYRDGPWNCMSDWDIEFLESLDERFCQYGSRTRMTEKQWEQFERIEGKMYG